jgi:hypothetical protein
LSHFVTLVLILVLLLFLPKLEHLY